MLGFFVWFFYPFPSKILTHLIFQKVPEQSSGYSASLWHSGGMTSPLVDDCEA